MKCQKTQIYFPLFYLLLSLLYSIPSFPCPAAFDTEDSTLSDKKYKTPSYTRHPTPSDKKYLTLIEAKKVVRELKIRSLWELKEKRKTNDVLKRIPPNLVVAYRDQGWISFADFFGTTHEWYLYRKLKAYYEELDLQNTVFNDSFRGESLALNYWVTIDHVFQYLVHDKSVEWHHFIYEDSQAIIQRLNIKTMDDLRNRRKQIRIKFADKNKVSQDELSLLHYVPADPRQFYRDQNWSKEDFFAKEWLPVNEAQALVQELGITSVFELWNRRKTDTRLQNIPSHPGQIYRVDYPTFFGLKEVLPSPEQIKQTKEEYKSFLKLIYSIVGMFPGMLPTPHELKLAVARAHLQKLAIESAF